MGDENCGLDTFLCSPKTAATPVFEDQPLIKDWETPSVYGVTFRRKLNEHFWSKPDDIEIFVFASLQSQDLFRQTHRIKRGPEVVARVPEMTLRADCCMSPFGRYAAEVDSCVQGAESCKPVAANFASEDVPKVFCWLHGADFLSLKRFAKPIVNKLLCTMDARFNGKEYDEDSKPLFKL